MQTQPPDANARRSAQKLIELPSTEFLICKESKLSWFHNVQQAALIQESNRNKNSPMKLSAISLSLSLSLSFSLSLSHLFLSLTCLSLSPVSPSSLSPSLSLCFNVLRHKVRFFCKSLCTFMWDILKKNPASVKSTKKKMIFHDSFDSSLSKMTSLPSLKFIVTSHSRRVPIEILK